MDLKTKFRHVFDFPIEGIDFIDITTVLQDNESLRYSVDLMEKSIAKFEDFDLIISPEARGFVFGMPIAYNLNKGFIPIRKKGKLPYNTVSVDYGLEYGKNTIEIHEDAVKPGQKVIIVDDLLATGGTTKAMVELIEKLGGIVVGICVLIELDFLKGRDILPDCKIESAIHF